jgi:nitrogen fixation NifU-like protein
VLTEPATGVVSDISWDGQGCAISVASMSILAETVTGKPVSDARDLHTRFLDVMHGRTRPGPELGEAVAFEGVAQFPARVKCALLGWMAVDDALNQASDGNLGGNND